MHPKVGTLVGNGPYSCILRHSSLKIVLFFIVWHMTESVV